MTSDSFASTPDIRRKMQRQRRHDTPIELALRAELFRRGLRYYVHRRPIPGLRREADIVFPGARLAVFVDSCWWHACPEHGRLPKANRAWWAEKLQANNARDRDTTERFEAAGWTVIRVWEHEVPTEAVTRVVRAVREARGRSTTSDVDRPANHRDRERGSEAPHWLSGGADSRARGGR